MSNTTMGYITSMGNIAKMRYITNIYIYIYVISTGTTTMGYITNTYVYIYIDIMIIYKHRDIHTYV